MDRNNTSFPAHLTAELRRAYEEYEALRRVSGAEDDPDAPSDRQRLAAVLKYYQYLVSEYLNDISTRPLPGAEAAAARDVPRGLLLYHLMGMGKTFSAISAALIATGAIDPRGDAPGSAGAGRKRPSKVRQVILVADKSLHANFLKGAKFFLSLYYPANAPAADAALEKVRAGVKFVTMNAHNMADQVLKATSLYALAGPKKSGAKKSKSKAARADKAAADPRGALDGSLLVVDEAHGFFRAIINSADPNTNARRLFNMVMNASDIRLLFMTGTPSSKDPFELVPCFNMLAGREVLPVQYDLFTRAFVDTAGHRMRNRGLFVNRIVGLVSYAGYDIPATLADEELKTGGGEDSSHLYSMPSRRGSAARGKSSRLGGGRGGRGGRQARGAPRASGPTLFVVADLESGLRAAQKREVKDWYRPTSELGQGDHVFLFAGDKFVAHAVVRPVGAASSLAAAEPSTYVAAPPGTRWLEDVYVHPNHRGSGGADSPGARIIGKAKEIAAESGRMRLATLSKPELKSFYVRLGFGVAGDTAGHKLMVQQLTYELIAPTMPEPAQSLDETGNWRAADKAAKYVDLAWMMPRFVEQQHVPITAAQKARYYNVKSGLKNALTEAKAAITDKSVLYKTLAADKAAAQFLPRTFPFSEVRPEDLATEPLIVKDPSSWSQRGVYIVADEPELSRVRDIAAQAKNAKDWIASEHVRNPLLWRAPDGTWRKFHIRAYLLAFADHSGGAEFYLCERAPVFTAALPYSPADWHNRDRHLTGAKRTDDYTLTWLRGAEERTDFSAAQVKATWAAVTEMMTIVARRAAPHMRPYAESGAGFEVFGADIMIDEAGQPWLLEVNAKCGFTYRDTALKLFEWAREAVIEPYFGIGAGRVEPIYRANRAATADGAKVELAPLASLSADELAALSDIGSRPEVYKALGRGDKPWDLAEFRERIRWSKSADASNYRDWAIRTNSADKEPGRIVGYIGLRPANPKQAKGKPGVELQPRYFVGEEFARRGYGTDALRVALAVPGLGERATYATVSPGNAASIKVLERVGFKPSGETTKSGKPLVEMKRDPAHAMGGAESATGSAESVAGGELVTGGAGSMSFPERLPTIIREVEMSEPQYRQYLMARDKEMGEGGRAGAGGRGGPPGAAKPPPALALPGSERDGGSTYYVQSRMFGNFAPMRKFMPTRSVLDPNSVTQVDPRLTIQQAEADPTGPRGLPDEAFTAETSPKIMQILEDIEDGTERGPMPFLVYSQFVGIGGLAVVERFLTNAGYEKFNSGMHMPESARVTGGGAVRRKKPAAAHYADVFDDHTPDELAAVQTVLGSQNLVFAPEDLILSAHCEAGPQLYHYAQVPALPYREDKGSMAYRYTNLHRGQRKLHLTELWFLTEELKRDGDKFDTPFVCVYAGAAAGYHLPYLAELFPGGEFYLYDPAPFASEVRGHPRLHVQQEFFTDTTAREWGEGGAQALRHGRPDFFICDIRLGSDSQKKFEVAVDADMKAQRAWTELMVPTRGAMLKFRPPYTSAKFKDENLVDKQGCIEYLEGTILRQIWPSRLSSETRIMVDSRAAAARVRAGQAAQMPAMRLDVTRYENDCYTHNTVTRPWVRFLDYPGLSKLVRGYDGSWDCRAEAETWARYEEFAGVPATEASIAKRFNGLSKVLRKSILAPGTKTIEVGPRGMTSGHLAGHFPGIRGAQFAQQLVDRVVRDDLESQRKVAEVAKKKQSAAMNANKVVRVSEDMRGAMRCFPLSPEWLAVTLQIAESPQPFSVDLHLAVTGTDSRFDSYGTEKFAAGYPLRVPNAAPTELMSVHLPQRSLALAVVHFLAHAFRGVTRATFKGALVGLDPECGCARLVRELFPGLAVRGPKTSESADSEEPDQVKVIILESEDAKRAPELHISPDRPMGAGLDAAYWSCWGSTNTPGHHYKFMQRAAVGDDEMSLGDLVEDSARAKEKALQRVATHLIYDRSWSRFMVPTSASLGNQGLTDVSGYDGCWDCTAEAHIWIQYVHLRHAAGVQVTAAECMRLAGRYTDDSLKSPYSAHGRIISISAASAISKACEIAQHARMKRVTRGGDASDTLEDDTPEDEAPPRPATAPAKRRFAVYSGEVSAEERAAIQRAWVSPENKYGDVIYGILVSKTGAQGLDLKYGRKVFLLEPYWDKSLEDQVIARFVRLNALDDLPPEERTVQPYLYLATANAAVQSAMAPDTLEIPVAASNELPRGTTVDVAFHRRALNKQELNADARSLLQAASIECALYGSARDGGPDCRICRPTGVVLFHDSVEEDLRLPDPCEVMVEKNIEVQSVVIEVGGSAQRYHYVTDPEFALGYRFYEPSDEFNFRVSSSAKDRVHKEVDPATELYAQLVAAVESNATAPGAITGVNDLLAELLG